MPLRAPTAGWAGKLLFPALFLSLAGCGEPPAGSETSHAAVEAFLSRHWAIPVPEQGAPPAQYPALEAALDANACGTCHQAQFQDWRKSFHAQAMGPGVLGQLLDSPPADLAGRQDCLRCHAPLAEQAASLTAALLRNAAAGEKTPLALHEQGLNCAACHVRGHIRFGPPRRDGSRPSAGAQLPHDGWVASAAFSDSRFCAACHQFAADGLALNGKLLENTYEEWQASRHAREGRQCQSCHMPERRHLWRGIHDPDMVRQAVSLAPTPLRLSQGRIETTFVIRNHGAGHHFPTYVTPQVVIEIAQLDAAGRSLPGTALVYVVARQVSEDLSRELSDTRIPAGGELRLDYRKPLAKNARALVFRLRVEPDAFYQQFFRALLAGDGGRGEAMLGAALAAAERSAFVAIEHRQALPVSASNGKHSGR